MQNNVLDKLYINLLKQVEREKLICISYVTSKIYCIKVVLENYVDRVEWSFLRKIMGKM
jgi:hypothetical protein